MHLLIRHTIFVGFFAFAFCGCAANEPEPAVVIRPVRMYDISQVEVIPKVLSQVLPYYPFELRREGHQGEAMIGFFVFLDGSVSDAVIWRATDIRFGEAARSAVMKWRYKPAEIDHHPVVCAVTVRIRFKFTDDETPQITTTDGLSLEEIIKEANQPPLRMPVSGTPAAASSAEATEARGAPVAPPSGAAGR